VLSPPKRSCATGLHPPAEANAWSTRLPRTPGHWSQNGRSKVPRNAVRSSAAVIWRTGGLPPTSRNSGSGDSVGRGRDGAACRKSGRRGGPVAVAPGGVAAPPPGSGKAAAPRRTVPHPRRPRPGRSGRGRTLGTARAGGPGIARGMPDRPLRRGAGRFPGRGAPVRRGIPRIVFPVSLRKGPVGRRLGATNHPGYQGMAVPVPRRDSFHACRRR
jgi:hypothetical protein